MTTKNTVMLSDLPGKPGKTEAVVVKSVAGVLQAIRKGYAATAAADYGCFNIWEQTEGLYRCERQRLMVIHDSATFISHSAVADWAKQAFQIIRTDDGYERKAPKAGRKG